MPKILSQSGVSLADTYDIQGSIAGIEQLRSEEVGLVHEMGGTIFSERLSASIRRRSTGAVDQSTSWDLVLQDLPAVPTRILGIVVLSANASRVSNCSVSIRDALSGREMPIFIWDSGEPNITARFVENDGAAANVNFLINSLGAANSPTLLIGNGQPQPVSEIAFRGLSTGFGAGTVTVTALIYIAFSQLGSGISSKGLPVPSW